LLYVADRVRDLSSSAVPAARSDRAIDKAGGTAGSFAAMAEDPDLLTLCGRCGLRLFDDYTVRAGGVVVISEQGRRKLEAAAARDLALPRLLFDASSRELEKTLRLGGVSRRLRRRVERMLRQGR
jgi:hypothetical protein